EIEARFSRLLLLYLNNNSYYSENKQTTNICALRNPTVRLRYLAARDVLNEYGHIGFYDKLLKLLGCVDLTANRVEQHLSNLEHTFDDAAAAAKTPFFFITATSRPIAIDGSRELITTGNHLEAIFWIIATFARCHK